MKSDVKKLQPRHPHHLAPKSEAQNVERSQAEDWIWRVASMYPRNDTVVRQLDAMADCTRETALALGNQHRHSLPMGTIGDRNGNPST